MTKQLVIRLAALFMLFSAAGPVFATYFIATYVPELAAPQPTTLPVPTTASAVLPVSGLAPGLYVQVLDGAIHATNPAGTQNFGANQFGYVASFTQPPVMLPTNPGIPFSLPPLFNASTAPSSTSSAAKPGDVDCVVR